MVSNLFSKSPTNYFLTGGPSCSGDSFWDTKWRNGWEGQKINVSFGIPFQMVPNLGSWTGYPDIFQAFFLGGDQAPNSRNSPRKFDLFGVLHTSYNTSLWRTFRHVTSNQSCFFQISPHLPGVPKKKRRDWPFFLDNFGHTVCIFPLGGCSHRIPMEKMKLKLSLASMNSPKKMCNNHGGDFNYPVIWKIPGLFSSPISREIDHPGCSLAPPISQPS